VSERPSAAIQSNWQVATYGGTALYVAFSFIYLIFGQANADEGWYLYASKLVFQGNVPYRDFAYTQTPLLPYVYGLPQLLSPSLYLGRATSMLFSFTTFLISVSIAHRYAGRMGAGVTALLLCSFTQGIYFLTIVKTYSLLCLFFALTLLVLTSRISDKWKYPLAVTFSFFAAMVRLSAVVFMVAIVVYSLWATLRRPTRFVSVLALCIALACGVLAFLLPDPDAAKWDLLTYHAIPWGHTSLHYKLNRIVFFRIPDFWDEFDVHVILLFSLFFVAIRDGEIRARIWPCLRHNSALIIVGIGLILFLVVHLGAGSWYTEYCVPAVTSFLPLVAILFAKLYPLQKTFASRIVLECMLVACLVSPFGGHNVQHVDISGGSTPVGKIREVSNFISRHSGASDKAFALEALWAAVESDRAVLPGMTMAQFSYQNVSRNDAERYKIVNGEIVREYLSNRLAKIIILTDGDWLLLKSTGYDEVIRQALLGRYQLALTRGEFGQQANNVYVYMPSR
jgi:hypothetical protein